MSKFTRRQILMFFGSSVAASALAPTLERRLSNAGDPTIVEAAQLSFTPVRLPHPLPIYQQQQSFLPTGIGVGEITAAASDTRLSQYSVLDDVVVPPEYERYVIVSWGDRVFPNKDDYFGYNNDYTGYVGSTHNGYLWVNHEYVSYPMTRFAPETPADLATATSYPETGPLVVPGFPTTKNRELLGELLYNIGGSIVRISRPNHRGKFAVVESHPKNRRIHGLSGLKINRQRTDGYQSVTSWGAKSYQQGNEHYLTSTGPAAADVFTRSSDGLGNKIIGTGFNCSGGTSPWGTVLSCEENFQGSSAFFVGVTESVKPDGTQTAYSEGTTGAEFGLVGEKYGWVVEIDPANPSFRPRKHTSLGRYRHENIALRAQAGRKLIAYMGDDRRGGHTWKFVSTDTVASPKDKSNSKLFETGTLYVAKFNADGTGKWIPLLLNAATNPIPPSTLASVEIAQRGAATRNGLLKLPKRTGIAAQTSDGGAYNVDTTNETTALYAYQGKTLADFYPTQGAILSDAFLAANLIGGTPTARPEDIEINPRTKEVFISYTDGYPGSDGYPDSRIFVVSKYNPAINGTQHLGGIYKIIEESADGAGLTFRWQRFVQGGEAGAADGTGFAQVDNLVFDNRGNIWGVTDMSTGTHNGFATGGAGTPITVDHTVKGEATNINAVYGNNWMFYIPTTGQHAGELVPFAYGPPRCEMTGPTFVGNTLIVSVQHPGEDSPYSPKQILSRTIEILNLDGTLFNQRRTVPQGSNWPSNIADKADGPPKPSVIGIHRKASGGQFV